MNILKEILSESFLLREDASVNAINNAVNNMHPVIITYNGPSGSGLGEREIYPVAYGISTAGNPVVRAFQPKGDTSTDVPAWKFFRIDRIRSWKNDNSRTFDPKELNGFNDGGDEQIETLYAISPISGAERKAEPEKEPEKVITPHPVSKREVDNGGSDKNTEKQYYTANDAITDIIKTSNPKISPVLNKNIDNMAGMDYASKENQPAAEPAPIMKKDIAGPEQNTEPESNIKDTLYANDGPVTKKDVDSENISNNDLTNAFKDITNRMDNLYNDEEEKI